jgi:hypothetical protein
LQRRRPDLVVLIVNTAPTGTAVVIGVDQASTILKDTYAEEEDYLLRPDPQTPPLEYMERSNAIEPDVLIDSPVRPPESRHWQNEIRRLSPLGIRYLISTDFHGDHVTGAAFKKA